jgi:HEAT repeat protein
MNPRCSVRDAIPLSVVAAMLIAGGAGAAPKLRYGFEQGRKYVYEVKITATLDDAVETREGLSIYVVKSADVAASTLTHSGSFSTQRKATGPGPLPRLPGWRGAFPWSDNLVVRTGDLTIGPQGKLIKTSVETALPYMLGDLEMLAIEELPAEGTSKWEQKREVVITQRQQPVFPRGPFAPTGETGPKRSAEEVSSYSVASTAGKTIRLGKNYRLEAIEKVDGQPRLQLTGKGELVFDTQEGVIRSLAMEYTFRVTDTNLTWKVPLTVNGRLLEAAEAEARLKAQEAARAAALAAAAKANEPKPLEAGEREQLLRDLKARDEWTVRRAADRLAKAPADEQPKEVAEALTGLLADRNGWIRAAVAKALVNWATPGSASALVQAAADEDLWVRKAAIQALGRLKTAEGAKAVAARLVHLQDRGDAASSLKAMGAVAEPEVLPYLKDRDGWVRLEACKVLGEIGTDKSLAALEEFGRNGQGFDRPESEKAIRAIKARQ